MKRRRALAAVAALVLVVSAGAAAETARATTRSETQLAALNHEVLAAINSFRVAHHLVPLRESPRLDASARQHSFEMGADGYFAHPSASGQAFWKRIEHYYGSSGYRYWSVGENLLWSSPDVDAATAMQMWIASPEHLRNLLTPGWRVLGVSAVHVLDAPGVYHGLPVTIITTDFGVRH
ncbi:MAG TPA: CAP domain-containing protein [Gaiellaceae bacterium]|nr:CAP domain-containing protein [Gaiellaceae bacterium]